MQPALSKKRERNQMILTVAEHYLLPLILFLFRITSMHSRKVLKQFPIFLVYSMILLHQSLHQFFVSQLLFFKQRMLYVVMAHAHKRARAQHKHTHTK